MTERGPFFLIVNGGSGKKDVATTRTIIEEAFNAAGRPYHLHVVDEPGTLDRLAADMAQAAASAGGVLVAVGGDGTLRTVAEYALEHDVRFGVLPTGTFNYFGRSYGIPTDLQGAIAGLLTATERAVQIGLLNDHVFLVNASVGLYPQLFEDREAFQKKYGRNKLVARWAGIVTLLREHRALLLRYEHENREMTVYTSTLFVGNSRAQLTEVGLEEAGVIRQGRLAAVIVRALGKASLFRVVLHGIMGALGEAAGVDHFSFRELTVRPRMGTGPRRVKVAIDGETLELAMPLVFKAAPRALRLLVPLTKAPA